MAIMEGQAARAWTIDQGIIFFDDHFYLPAASALLPDLLQVLRHGGSANIELLALGAHLPPTHGTQLNRMPSHILLGRSWLLR
jgi:hypothetical protein